MNRLNFLDAILDAIEDTAATVPAMVVSAITFSVATLVAIGWMVKALGHH